MKFKITVTLVIVAAFSVSIFMCGCGKKERTSFSDMASTENSSESVNSENLPEESVGEVFVYVCGAVQSPGVYGFLTDARVRDAIVAADGFKEDAATDYLNQAEFLRDGEKIYVPTKEEVLNGYKSEDMNDKLDSESVGIESDGRVNINFASSEELQTISGIGETRALAIIEYREINGIFSSVDEITKVSGIGESTYQKIKDLICV